MNNRTILIIAAAAITAYLVPLMLIAEPRVIPQDLFIEQPTLNCAGFEWYVVDDDNHNATVAVQFRRVGEQDWIEGLPMLRIQREKIHGHRMRWAYETPNMFAGSIFGLEQGTTYECRFVMSDPDGVEGDSDTWYKTQNVGERTVLVTTRSEPKPFAGGNTYHVYPPGYEGSKVEPAYTGLNEAYYGDGNLGDWWMAPEPRVKPGDIIIVHAGLYKGDRFRYCDPLALDFHGAYVFTQDGTPDKPIVIKAAGDGEVIFDGDGCYRLFDVMAADYHYFEGLTIRNTDVVFYAGLKRVAGCSGLTVKNCRMEDVGVGVLSHWAESREFYIADNVLIGRHDRTRLQGWSFSGVSQPITSYVAIKVYGQGHVICHNYIAYFHDGVCVDSHGLPEGGPGERCSSIDIHNNDIFLITDDFIEADGGVHNIRIYNNRGVNAYTHALSGQTVFGGPAYYIRNVFYHIPGGALKFGLHAAGFIVYNNVFCSEANFRRYSNGHFRNNLFLGNRPDQPALLSGSCTSYTSFDYNGYNEKPIAENKFVWWQPVDKLRDYTFSENDMLFYDGLESFRHGTGQEQHGIVLGYDTLMNIAPPDPEDPEHVYVVADLDFRPKPGSAVVDNGCVLPTITDGFTGDAPDIGAYESGKTLPVYGPRR